MGADEMDFVNLEIDAIKKIYLQAILADEPFPSGSIWESTSRPSTA